MILDTQLEFADNLAAFAAVGTVVLANSIDLGAVGDRLGVGAPLPYLVVSVTQAFAEASATATVHFQLVSDSTDPAAGNGTESIHWDSGALVMADLALGKTFIVPLPSGTLVPYERYLSFQIVISGKDTTAGKINAFLTQSPQDYFAYPEGDS